MYNYINPLFFSSGFVLNPYDLSTREQCPVLYVGFTVRLSLVMYSSALPFLREILFYATSHNISYHFHTIVQSNGHNMFDLS